MYLSSADLITLHNAPDNDFRKDTPLDKTYLDCGDSDKTIGQCQMQLRVDTSSRHT